MYIQYLEIYMCTCILPNHAEFSYGRPKQLKAQRPAPLAPQETNGRSFNLPAMAYGENGRRF